ncbi:hypothetical protein ANO11243_044570 [Dothideomycetidae sp. 11243]|nr:hypothetical protein ANO11243_044570 [fungal sp. No.11243]
MHTAEYGGARQGGWRISALCFTHGAPDARHSQGNHAVWNRTGAWQGVQSTVVLDARVHGAPASRLSLDASRTGRCSTSAGYLPCRRGSRAWQRAAVSNPSFPWFDSVRSASVTTLCRLKSRTQHTIHERQQIFPPSPDKVRLSPVRPCCSAIFQLEHPNRRRFLKSSSTRLVYACL